MLILYTIERIQSDPKLCNRERFIRLWTLYFFPDESIKEHIDPETMKSRMQQIVESVQWIENMVSRMKNIEYIPRKRYFTKNVRKASEWSDIEQIARIKENSSPKAIRKGMRYKAATEVLIKSSRNSREFQIAQTPNIEKRVNSDKTKIALFWSE